ncbi:MAG: DUF2232 domain-containing protein [Alphaproteobacteria bacterium]|nr:DUF2232 domain-containing protein [Alphaproteobacteria bacterium]
MLGTTPTYLLVGLVAGLVAALFFGAVITGSAVSIGLVFLIPLPLFVAGLGWGVVSVLAGAVVGIIALVFMAGFKVGLAFALQMAAAPVILSYLALISRPAPPGPNGEENGVEWYPEGRLVLWTAAIITAMIGTIVLVGGIDKTMLNTWGTEAIGHMTKLQKQVAGEGGNADALDNFKAAFESLVPHILSITSLVWMVMTLAVFGLATRLLGAARRNIRTWAPFCRLEFPRGATIALAAGVGATFLPGQLGLIGEAGMVAMVTAFCLLGLAAIHGILEHSGARTPLLFFVYTVIFFFPFALPVVLALGFAEHTVGLRARFARKAGGSSGPSAT